MMPMPMASQVDRRTLGGRLAATWRWDDSSWSPGSTPCATSTSARGSKYDMMTDYYTDADQFPWSKDAVFHNSGAFGELTWFAAERDRLIGGLRLDRASVKDYRQTLKSGHMGHAMAPTRRPTTPAPIPCPAASCATSMTLPTRRPPSTPALAMPSASPDYWELFSLKRGPNGSVNAFDKIQAGKTTQPDFGLQYNGDKLQAWASATSGWSGLHPVQLSRGHDGLPRPRRPTSTRGSWAAELGASYQLTGNWKTDASLAMPGARTARTTARCRRSRRWKRASA